MSRMLQRFGHDVSQAENGSLALDMLRERQFKNEKQFDILFLDKYVTVLIRLVAISFLTRLPLAFIVKCRSCLESRRPVNCGESDVESSLLVQPVMR